MASATPAHSASSLAARMRGVAKALGGLCVLGAMVVGVSTTRAAGPPAKTPKAERHLTLFYTAEVHGAVEPCGCTSDPLGDLSRLAALMSDTKRGGRGVALMDAGGLLYPEGTITAKERPSADLRAAFLASQFEGLGLIGATIGESDLAARDARVRPPRLASNLVAGTDVVRPPRVERVGGIAVGVLGIVDPQVGPALKAKVEDTNDAARRDVATLRRGGAEVVVLLAAVDKPAARKLARESGADIVVLGKRVGAGMPRLERVGRAFVVAPAEEMQRVGRLDIVLRTASGSGGEAPLVIEDAGGPEANRLRQEEIDRALERLRTGLRQWTAKPGDKSDGMSRADGRTTAGPSAESDAAFIAAKQKEVAELEAERARLNAAWAPPTVGNYLTNTLVPLRRALRREPRVVAAMKSLDQRIAALNLKHAVAPPPAEAGRASYVGMDKCTSCHAGATVFWKRTVHARAWKTLVDGGKQADYKCTGCHVTGFGEVGGSSLGFTKKLESVQCETCHGPGSLHVAGEGNEEPLAIKRDTPETVCAGCHTEQHSDTFQYDPYMRDIVGAGHGPKRRENLGPGVTGHELRSAALAKAKRADKAMQASGATGATGTPHRSIKKL